MKNESAVRQLLNRLLSLNDAEALGDYSQECDGMVSTLRWVLGESEEVEEFVVGMEESVKEAHEDMEADES